MVAVGDFTGPGSAKQRRLAAGALRRPGNAQSGVNRCQGRTVGQSHGALPEWQKKAFGLKKRITGIGLTHTGPVDKNKNDPLHRIIINHLPGKIKNIWQTTCFQFKKGI